MSEVDFLEDNEFHTSAQAIVGKKNESTFAKILVKLGIAKNTKDATIILIVIIVLLFLVTLFIIFKENSSGNQTTPIVDRFGNVYTPEQYIQELQAGRNPLSPNFVPVK